jgi:hypothetical protein
MDEQPVKVLGTLHPDGTLELAERPSLPAGQVEVTIRPATAERKAESLINYLQRTRAELEASGAVFRTKEEIDADLAADRDWGEDRFDEIYRQTEEERRRNHQAEGPSQASDIQP